MSGYHPPEPSNPFLEIVQVGRNGVGYSDVTLYYDSGQGRGSIN